MFCFEGAQSEDVLYYYFLSQFVFMSLSFFFIRTALIYLYSLCGVGLMDFMVAVNSYVFIMMETRVVLPKFSTTTGR